MIEASTNTGWRRRLIIYPPYVPWEAIDYPIYRLNTASWKTRVGNILLSGRLAYLIGGMVLFFVVDLCLLVFR
jgi:hypothetical protein